MKYKIYILILLLPLFYSCRSSKSIAKEIHESRSDLYYELTNPPYSGKIKNDVYLSFIDYSNMDYYTTVKKKGTVIIPLILYNYASNRFEARLGEQSLTLNYREFLTEALLAECNNSTCFNLIGDKEDTTPDSAYVLKVKVIQNQTTSRILMREHALFTGIFWMMLGADNEDFSNLFAGGSNHKVKPAVTDLKIRVSLTKENKPVFEKEYHIKRAYQSSQSGFGDSHPANTTCREFMAESLSLATKEIVEEISQELHLLILPI